MLARSDLDRDHSLLKDAILKAGDIALGYFQKSPASSIKKDGSPVSEADFAVNEYLKQRLLLDRKDYGWLSEESEDNTSRLDKHNVWVIDPIDGTRAFINGKSEWTISGTLVSNGLPVLATVYNPVTDECFDSILGRKTKLNGVEITTSQTQELQDCTLIPPSKSDKNTQSFAKKWVSSIAYRLCLLSSGRVDAVITKAGAYDWDIAAAHLILQNAGGRLTCLENQNLSFNNPCVRHGSLLATNGLLHTKLLNYCSKIKI